jgi:hypothetical protein
VFWKYHGLFGSYHKVENGQGQATRDDPEIDGQLTVNRPMRSTLQSLRYAIELRSESFPCCIFAGNLTSLSTVQSYLCGG